MGSIVKIHGRYCGPNWTAGRNVAAADYLKANPDFSSWPQGIDPLDNACKRHDYNCAIHDGCTKADDTLLIKAASRRRLSQAQIARRQLSLLNPFMSSLRRQQIQTRLEESNKARQVEAGITAARLTRKR